MHKVKLTKDKQTVDITELVSELSWSENIDTVGISLSFYVPDSEERYITRLAIVAGDIIQVFNDTGEMIRAVVVNVNREYPKRKVKAMDFGFYLNKNEIVIQFKNKSVSECLKQMFTTTGITVGSVCDMPAKIKGIYIKNVNEIIKELIQIQQSNDGKKYYYELRAEKIYIFQMPDKPINYIFKPTTNVAEFDITDKNAHSRGKYSHSIENTKNCIIAQTSSKTNGKMPEKQFIARDEESIKKYGLLSENFKVDSDDADNITELAKNELKDKSVLKRELSMDFIGHDSARVARVMHIVDEYLGIDGNYRITEVSHRIKGSIHTMSCNLESL